MTLLTTSVSVLFCVCYHFDGEMKLLKHEPEGISLPGNLQRPWSSPIVHVYLSELP